MGSRIKSTKSAGYTIIELLIVFSILGLVIALSENSLHLFVSQIGIQDTSTSYVQSLRRARSLATTGRGDTSWGVRIATSTITVFKGASYAARDTAYDESFQTGVSYTVSGVSEVVFARFTGIPNTTGTTTITVSGTTPKDVHINAKGTVTY